MEASIANLQPSRHAMFDEHSQRTIELCLLAAEDAMERSSIGVRRTSIDQPHGFTLLFHFDNEYRSTRVYRPGHGMAPFRSFIRATPNTVEYDRQAYDLLMQLGELENFFRPFLADPHMEIPEVTEGYIRELRFGDTAAWPDDLYYNLTYKADELFRDSTKYLPPRFVDVAEISPKELHAVPAHLKYENAIKNAVDLVCMGPWAGLSIPRIIQALKKLHKDLSQGKQDMEPPILQCLEPRTTQRLTIPLWRAGRFHGVFSVVMGGSLEQLKPLDGLVADCVSVSHLLFSVMQRERERRAKVVLRSGLLHQTHPTESIRQAAHVLTAPHYVRDVTVDCQKSNANNSHFNKDEGEKESLRFTVQETLFDRRIRIQVELFDEKRKIIRDLMRIYVSNELRRIHAEISAELTAKTASGDERGAQSNTDFQERATRILRENENDMRCPNKKYASCLVSLAILEQRNEEVIKIHGYMSYKYQEKLRLRYKIGRRTKPSSNATNQENDIYLSHIFDAPALEYVKKQFRGADISKGHNRVEIRFRMK